jgi:hypothetical protein
MIRLHCRPSPIGASSKHLLLDHQPEGVAVAVGVAEGVAVAVGIAEGVTVAVGVAVAVGVTVAVGVASRGSCARL